MYVSGFHDIFWFSEIWFSLPTNIKHVTINSYSTIFEILFLCDLASMIYEDRNLQQIGSLQGRGKKLGGISLLLLATNLIW